MITKENALDFIQNEYARLDALLGIDTKNISVSLSNRLSRKLGYFRIEKKNIFTRPKVSIVISAKILDDENLFLDVVRHEYAHAAVYIMHPREKHKHDKVWKDVCRKVGCRPRASVKESEINA